VKYTHTYSQKGTKPRKCKLDYRYDDTNVIRYVQTENLTKGVQP